MEFDRLDLQQVPAQVHSESLQQVDDKTALANTIMAETDRESRSGIFDLNSTQVPIAQPKRGQSGDFEEKEEYKLDLIEAETKVKYPALEENTKPLKVWCLCTDLAHQSSDKISCPEIKNMSLVDFIKYHKKMLSNFEFSDLTYSEKCYKLSYHLNEPKDWKWSPQDKMFIKVIDGKMYKIDKIKYYKLF